jgi:AraC family transcriptional regulator, regulatory protein of adaptative response / DNA-3-methyladenine glycosylase II
MLDDTRCFDAMRARDARFDGTFFIAVKTTGIYCRPSCPTPIQPKRVNVTFHRTAASAQRAGFRACKRCRPDASPGSPEWNARGDLVGRAMRSIVDGLVDREGVSGLARSLAVSERHLHRMLVDEVGAGPLEVARSQRAQTARLLIETTTLTSSEIAFAAGFSSIRQFHDTVREVFAASPTELRGGLNARQRTTARRFADAVEGAAPVSIRLRARTPFDVDGLLGFLAVRAVAGVEVVDASTRTYARTLRLPGGPGTVEATLADDAVTATFRLADIGDLATASARLRRAFDLDSDTAAIDDHLCTDEALAPLVRATPGRRVPGTVDPHEIAVRAVLGQQVSVAGAKGTAGRLVLAHGEPFATGVDGLTHLFPSAAALGSLDPSAIPIPRSRGRALVGLCAAIADGSVELDIGADRARTREQLVGCFGIGPWTADYILIRALREPDAFLPTDLGVKHAADRLGLSSGPADLEARSQRWRPWRSAALFHLWSVLS